MIYGTCNCNVLTKSFFLNMRKKLKMAFVTHKKSEILHYHIQYPFRTYSHLNNVDPDQYFNWVIARQSLKKTTGGVSSGDGRVFNVIREGDLVDFQGSLKNINSSFMF